MDADFAQSAPGSRFDGAADDYQRYRPGYPPKVALDIVSLAQLNAGARILEIGCGAGQATRLFEAVNPRQLSIDPGENLLRKCADIIADLPEYHLQQCRFEDFHGEKQSFDLIYAATSFHWVKSADRYRKLARLLAPGGVFARVTHCHRKDLGGFFTRAQTVYREIAPDMRWKPRLPFEGINDHTEPLRCVFKAEYDMHLKYTAETYTGLLRTFSDHIGLGSTRLNQLCQGLRTIIDTDYGGEITKTLTVEVAGYILF